MMVGYKEHEHTRLGWMMILALGAMLGSCSASLLLKAPVQDQCQQAGLHGCEELSEGVLLYIEGKKEEGQKLVVRGVAQNAPENVKQYALLVRELADLPAAGEFGKLLIEVADLIGGQPEHSLTANSPSHTSTSGSIVVSASTIRSEKEKAELEAKKRTEAVGRAMRYAMQDVSKAMQQAIGTCKSTWGEDSSHCATDSQGIVAFTARAVDVFQSSDEKIPNIYLWELSTSAMADDSAVTIASKLSRACTEKCSTAGRAAAEDSFQACTKAFAEQGGRSPAECQAGPGVSAARVKECNSLCRKAGIEEIAKRRAQPVRERQEEPARGIGVDQAPNLGF